MPELMLNTGRGLPDVGFGTWEIPANATVEAVRTALDAGYRLIDTAKIYGNEAEVGQAVRESGLERSDIFVTSKLWNSDQGYDSALRAYQDSLDRLGLEYLDLYLIHWPATSKRHDSWHALEHMFMDRRVKAVGVCNYTIEHLEELASRSSLVPAINQVEFHPFIYEQQRPLLEYCNKKGIILEAYSPLNRLAGEPSGEAYDDIRAIATKHAKTPQQVVLNWCRAHGTLPLPRSKSAAHITDNFHSFDFTLDEADMTTLNAMSDGERVTWDPTGMG